MEIIAILAALITVASLVYAVKTNKEKIKFENLVKDNLAGIAGNVWSAKNSAHGFGHS